MKFGELVDMCIRMIENFDPKKAVSSFVDEFLKSVTNPHENVFIKQVFYGVIRYKSFLKVTTTRRLSRPSLRLYSESTVPTPTAEMPRSTGSLHISPSFDLKNSATTTTVA